MCGAMTAERTQKVVYVKDEAQGLVLSLSKHGRRRLAVSVAGKEGKSFFFNYSYVFISFNDNPGITFIS